MTLAISLERFLGICYPLSGQKRKSRFYIIPVLVVAILLCIPRFMETKTFEYNITKEVNTSNDVTEEIVGTGVGLTYTDLRINANYVRYYFVGTHFFASFAVPVTLILVLNCKILYEIFVTKDRVQR